jgi:hypothetical protein
MPFTGYRHLRHGTGTLRVLCCRHRCQASHPAGLGFVFDRDALHYRARQRRPPRPPAGHTPRADCFIDGQSAECLGKLDALLVR